MGLPLTDTSKQIRNERRRDQWEPMLVYLVAAISVSAGMGRSGTSIGLSNDHGTTWTYSQLIMARGPNSWS